MTTTPTAAHPLSAEDLDKLEALAKAATAGPWMRLFGERTVYDRMEDGCRGNAIVRADLGYSNVDAGNLDFIAAANPSAILALIAQARAALTGQATAPAQAAPSEQDEPARGELLSQSRRDAIMAALRKAWPAGFKDTPDKAMDQLMWAVEQACIARAAQGASGAPTDEIAKLRARLEEVTDLNIKNVAENLKLKKRLRELEAAPSGASGAQGEPTGATGAAGGEELGPAIPESILYEIQRYGDYRADEDARASQQFGEVILAMRRHYRAAASQAAPGVGAEPHLVENVIAAAQAVVQDAIDGCRSEVHPCDRYDDDLAVRACSSEIRVLHAALKAFSALPAPAQPAGAAASIDTPEFRDLLHEVQALFIGDARAAKAKLIAHIYSKLAAPHAPVVRADVPTLYARQCDLDFQSRTRGVMMSWTAEGEWNVPFAASSSPSAPADPCPQCRKGGVCSMIECGRKRSSELMGLYGTPSPSAPQPSNQPEGWWQGGA